MVHRIEVGDHTLFVGKVLTARAEEEAFDQIWCLADQSMKPLPRLGSDVFVTPSATLHVSWLLAPSRPLECGENMAGTGALPPPWFEPLRS